MKKIIPNKNIDQRRRKMDQSQQFFGFENVDIGSNCEIINTNRGGRKLLCEGYIYYLDKRVSIF